MVAESLQRLFDHVYIARNGLEGWDVYLSHQPDIVLTDLNMPFMNGLELSKKIKHHNHDVPILLITAQFEKEITEVAVDIGIDGYLFKPISLIRLEIILNNYKHRISLKRKFRKEHKLLAEYKGAIDASASVTITDAQGFVTYVNNAFCAMSGYTREELIGKPHSIIKHPDTPESVYVDMWNQLSQKKIWKGRLKNLHKDGSIYFESLVIIPIIDEKNQILEYVSLRHDITDLYHQEQHLKQCIQDQVEKNMFLRQRQEEERLQEAKFSILGKMAAGITHEINTPLTYIKGNLEMMFQDIQELQNDIKQKPYLLEDITNVLDGVNRIANIVESMREMGSQKQEIPKEENVYAAIITALTLAYNKSKQITEIRVQNELFKIGMKKERFSYNAIFQVQRIEQVFVIIINNALDVLKQIDDFDKRLLEITLERTSEYIIIRFQDNDGGIDPEILPKIFDPFESKKVEGGMGIGLNVAKKIIDEHGGRLYASNQDNGALFEIYLPINSCMLPLKSSE
jgi:PAS domain S-box-containing protein